MRNLLVTIAFDGRSLHGWQIQKNVPTIMGIFQKALETVLKHKVEVKGCSRTDSGVSARMYCISFFTTNAIPCNKLPTALNINLPDAIAAYDCVEVDKDFHARYSCKKKEYSYTILNSFYRSPFVDGFSHHIPAPVFDENQLHQQAQDFVGTHDFKAFQNSGADLIDTTRTIYSASVTREGDMIVFKVCGDGFLYNMVRIMAGTLIDIGKGYIAPNTILDIIASQNRQNAGCTAPAGGLNLTKVFY